MPKDTNMPAHRSGSRWRIGYGDGTGLAELKDLGLLDEVVMDDWFHLENMDEDRWWMRVGDANIRVFLRPGSAVEVVIDRGAYGEAHGDARANATVELVRWWCRMEGAESPGQIADVFQYDSGAGVEALSREGFIRFRDVTAPRENLNVLEVLTAGVRTIVMFEVTDPLTGERHRTTWIVHFLGEAVGSIRACSAVVGPSRSVS